MVHTHSHRAVHADPREVQRSMAALSVKIGISFAQRRPSYDEPADILIKRIQDLRGSGNDGMAESILKDMLACDPCCRFAISELISIYSNSGRIKAAEAVFDYAHTRDIGGDGIHCAMISGYAKSMMKDAALTIFDMARVQGLLCKKSCKMAFYCALDANDMPALVEVFEKSAAAGHADSSMLVKAISTCVRSLGLQRAKELLSSNESLASAEAYMALVRGLGEANDALNAAKYCEDAIAKGMADAKLADCTIRLLDRLGNPGAAWDLYQNACNAGISDSGLHRTMLGICSRYDKPMRVKIIMDRAIRGDKDSPELYQDAVTLFASRTDMHWAIDALRIGCARHVLNVDSVSRIFGRLYSLKLYPRIVSLSEKLPMDLKQEPYIVLKTADAMRKCGDHGQAIRKIEYLLKKEGLSFEQIQRARAIMAYSLKDSGRKQEALELLLALRHEAPEDVRYSPRIDCGIVFCWQELRFPSRISPRMQATLYDSLSSFQQVAGGNLLYDIDCALAILSQRLGREDGRRSIAG